MLFTETPIPDTYLIDLEKSRDHRGFFGRMFCKEEFRSHGIEVDFCQANNSLSQEKGTLRGLHYQLAPRQECKLIRCINGAIWDVVLDLRSDSPTFGKSFGALLSDDNRKMMLVPEGCAHGFLTLTHNAELLYLVTSAYSQELERGIRWNDPQFTIEWPEEPKIISERDQNHPNYNPSYHQTHHFHMASQ